MSAKAIKYGLVIGTVLAVVLVMDRPHNKAPYVPPAPSATEAASACKYLTGKRLHDPDSAQFADYHTYPTETLSPTMYRVQVHVRAKNGFGALRNMVMECTVISAGGNWQLLDLSQRGG